MARSLKIPLGVDASGGAAMVESDDLNTQLIMTALSDCDNENAFQQELGLGPEMIFDLSDPGARAKILRRVYQIFDNFEAQHRFRLLRETIRWETEDGDLSLHFTYHDLESDELKPFAKTFSEGSTGVT